MLQTRGMKIAALLPALFALLVCAPPSFAQASAVSSPEDRQRFVTIVHKLERTPLDPSLQNDRSWAIQWLTDAPDVSVNVCADPIGGVTEKGYVHSPEIVVQYTLAMAAFVIENPNKTNDQDATQLAGVESALKAYRAMRVAEPNDRSPKLDDLLGMQSRGELPDFVRKAFLRCMAKDR